MITLSSCGIASILAFKSSAANVLHLVPDKEGGINKAIETAAKQIIVRHTSSILTEIITLIDVSVVKLKAVLLVIHCKSMPHVETFAAYSLDWKLSPQLLRT